MLPQVQNAMLRILTLTKDNPRVHVRVMTYNDQAEFHSISSTNMTAADIALKNIRASGMTSFGAVFDLLGSYLKTGSTGKLAAATGVSGTVGSLIRGVQGKRKAAAPPRQQQQMQQMQQVQLPPLPSYFAPSSADKLKLGDKASSSSSDKDSPREKLKTFVFFMTDGQDTCSSADQLMAKKEKLQKVFEEFGEQVRRRNKNVSIFELHHVSNSVLGMKAGIRLLALSDWSLLAPAKSTGVLWHLYTSLKRFGTYMHRRDMEGQYAL